MLESEKLNYGYCKKCDKDTKHQVGLLQVFRFKKNNEAIKFKCTICDEVAIEYTAEEYDSLFKKYHELRQAEIKQGLTNKLW